MKASREPSEEEFDDSQGTDQREPLCLFKRRVVTELDAVK